MFKKFGNHRKTDRTDNPKTAAVKDWVLFLGELVKASVEGVKEFWGNPKETASVELPSVEESVVEAAEEVEEILEAEEIVDDCVDEEETTEEARTCAKELRKQAKMIRKMAKRAKREENQIKRSEKKLKKLEKKSLKAEKKLEKAERKEEKAQKKAGYISKNVILSETEKRFCDGIKSAVGLRYVVKPRVAMADVLKRGDGSKCKDEQLGEMDFGVFDLQFRLKVLVEIKGLKRRGKQSQKVYKRVRKLCKKAGIPIVTFWAKYGVLPEYIKERMQDYLNV